MTNEEKMLDILAGMQSSMLEMRNEMNARFDAVENDILKTNIRIETNIIPKLDALAEGFAGILETRVSRREFDELTERVELLKMAQ